VEIERRHQADDPAWHGWLIAEATDDAEPSRVVDLDEGRGLEIVSIDDAAIVLPVLPTQ
jgi:hypothetical protein